VHYSGVIGHAVVVFTGRVRLPGVKGSKWKSFLDWRSNNFLPISQSPRTSKSIWSTVISTVRYGTKLQLTKFSACLARTALVIAVL